MKGGANVPQNQGIIKKLQFILKFNDLWERSTDILATLATILMVSFSALEIATRNLFSYSFVWANESAVFCFIWIAFLGVASNTRSGDHFTVDILPETWEKNKAWKIFLKVLKLGAQIIVGWVLVRYGWQYLDFSNNRFSYALGVKMSYIVAIIPIAGILVLCTCLEDIIKSFNGKGDEGFE